MNARQAKREACWRAGMAIDNALAGGWESLDSYGEDGRDKVESALCEVRDELFRRGGERP